MATKNLSIFPSTAPRQLEKFPRFIPEYLHNFITSRVQSSILSCEFEKRRSREIKTNFMESASCKYLWQHWISKEDQEKVKELRYMQNTLEYIRRRCRNCLNSRPPAEMIESYHSLSVWCGNLSLSYVDFTHPGSHDTSSQANWGNISFNIILLAAPWISVFRD